MTLTRIFIVCGQVQCQLQTLEFNRYTGGTIVKHRTLRHYMLAILIAALALFNAGPTQAQQNGT
jgi:hypothetical protein